MCELAFSKMLNIKTSKINRMDVQPDLRCVATTLPRIPKLADENVFRNLQFNILLKVQGIESSGLSIRDRWGQKVENHCSRTLKVTLVNTVDAGYKNTGYKNIFPAPEGVLYGLWPETCFDFLANNIQWNLAKRGMKISDPIFPIKMDFAKREINANN